MFKFIFNKRPLPGSEAYTSQYASKRKPAATFDKLCEWLEVCADELYSVTDLHQVMQELAGHGAEHYTQKRMKQCCSLNDMKAIKSLLVAGMLPAFIMACRIISDKWYQERQDSIKGESCRISRSRSQIDTHADS